MSTKPGSPRNTLIVQFLAYAVVGGISSIVDVGVFWLLNNAKFPLAVSATISFVLATLLNYVLSYTVAFARGRFSPREEVIRFWLVSLVGLVINDLLIYVFAKVAHLSPMVAKVITLPLVLVWNFLGRRLFVFHPDLPETTQNLLGGSKVTEPVDTTE